MSLIASNDSSSISPWSVFSTVPVGLGALLRIPLRPDAASSPPTRLGSYIIDTALPLRTVELQLAASTTEHARARDLRAPRVRSCCARRPRSLRACCATKLNSVPIHAAPVRSRIGEFDPDQPVVQRSGQGAGADLLEHLGDQRRDRRALAADQRHVCEKRMAFELFDHRRNAIVAADA